MGRQLFYPHVQHWSAQIQETEFSFVAFFKYKLVNVEVFHFCNWTIELAATVYSLSIEIVFSLHEKNPVAVYQNFLPFVEDGIFITVIISGWSCQIPNGSSFCFYYLTKHVCY